MKVSGLGRYPFCVSIGVAMLAGCGGSQPPIGAPGALSQRLTDSNLRSQSDGYEVRPPLLYVANFSSGNYGSITVYHATGKDPSPIATITDGISSPGGVCIDRLGILYVENETQGGAGWISEYRLGKTKPSLIIKDGINVPGYCAIDATGNLWVTNVGLNNVAEYPEGAKKPKTILKKGITRATGIAIDLSGNIYVSNLLTSSGSSIVVFAPRGKSPSRTITDGITSPAGITVDSNGTLYVPNLRQNNVEEYRPGQDEPFQTITETGHCPADVTVNKRGLLYVADFCTPYGVVEFPPGSLKPSKRQISNGVWAPAAVAYYPPLQP
jgi:hypothetical protein